MSSLHRVTTITVLTLGYAMLANVAQADEPPLVPRLIVTELQSGVDFEPDWLEPYSVALIAVPNDRADVATLRFTIDQDCDLIEQTIIENTDLDQTEAELYAAFVCEFLSGTTATTQNPLHATMGTVEPDEQGLVYWAGSVPPPGARAKSGPNGDVVFLGTFGIRQKDSTTDPIGCPGAVDCGDYEIVESGATRTVHLTIGWFTK